MITFIYALAIIFWLVALVIMGWVAYQLVQIFRHRRRG